jgi:hypothetical protein
MEMCRLGRAAEISYEECHRDFDVALRRVLTALDLPAEPAAIERAVSESRFDAMKNVELSGMFPKPWLRLRNGAPKMRQGARENFREHLSAEDILYLERLFQLPESS